MEHKGGRIKDHIRREEPQGQDDWIDVEWLDDDEDLDSRPDAASGNKAVRRTSLKRSRLR